MRLKNLAYAAAGLIAGVALTLVTVGSSAPAVSADEHENAMRMAQKAQLMTLVFQLDQSRFHDADEMLAAGTMPRYALGNVRKARVALMAADLPEEMHEMRAKLNGQMTELEAALRAEDVGAAAGPAKGVHDVAHDMSDAVYRYLGSAGGSPQPSQHGH